MNQPLAVDGANAFGGVTFGNAESIAENGDPILEGSDKADTQCFIYRQYEACTAADDDTFTKGTSARTVLTRWCT